MVESNESSFGVRQAEKSFQGYLKEIEWEDELQHQIISIISQCIEESPIEKLRGHLDKQKKIYNLYHLAVATKRIIDINNYPDKKQILIQFFYSIDKQIDENIAFINERYQTISHQIRDQLKQGKIENIWFGFAASLSYILSFKMGLQPVEACKEEYNRLTAMFIRCLFDIPPRKWLGTKQILKLIAQNETVVTRQNFNSKIDDNLNHFLNFIQDAWSNALLRKDLARFHNYVYNIITQINKQLSEQYPKGKYSSQAAISWVLNGGVSYHVSAQHEYNLFCLLICNELYYWKQNSRLLHYEFFSDIYKNRFIIDIGFIKAFIAKGILNCQHFFSDYGMAFDRCFTNSENDALLIALLFQERRMTLDDFIRFAWWWSKSVWIDKLKQSSFGVRCLMFGMGIEIGDRFRSYEEMEKDIDRFLTTYLAYDEAVEFSTRTTVPIASVREKIQNQLTQMKSQLWTNSNSYTIKPFSNETWLAQLDCGNRIFFIDKKAEIVLGKDMVITKASDFMGSVCIVQLQWPDRFWTDRGIYEGTKKDQFGLLSAGNYFVSLWEKPQSN